MLTKRAKCGLSPFINNLVDALDNEEEVAYALLEIIRCWVDGDGDRLAALNRHLSTHSTYTLTILHPTDERESNP